MDEPLSNLDAKLRVATRAEIAALQRELGVTTLYVTHDQVEAMTMGDRVAVMEGRSASAVRHTACALRRSRQRFRRRIHRVAPMNLLEGKVEAEGVNVGSTVIPVSGCRRPSARP